jgi:hypothetical protein
LSLSFPVLGPDVWLPPNPFFFVEIRDHFSGASREWTFIPDHKEKDGGGQHYTSSLFFFTFHGPHRAFGSAPFCGHMKCIEKEEIGSALRGGGTPVLGLICAAQ